MMAQKYKESSGTILQIVQILQTTIHPQSGNPKEMIKSTLNHGNRTSKVTYN